ncbi:MAG: PspC domain-containing protein [Firmicutes bacterium]|nr:PspC domain-containing protein [Bacillota bacterium]
MTGKTLYRSREQRMISGVCGGIGAYFNVDPTIIRLAWVLLSFFFSLGIGGLLAYIICAVIIPEEPA